MCAEAESVMKRMTEAKLWWAWLRKQASAESSKAGRRSRSEREDASGMEGAQCEDRGQQD